MQEGLTARKNIGKALRRMQEGWTARRNIERALRRMQEGWRAKKNAGNFDGSEKCRVFRGFER